MASYSHAERIRRQQQAVDASFRELKRLYAKKFALQAISKQTVAAGSKTTTAAASSIMAQRLSWSLTSIIESTFSSGATQWSEQYKAEMVNMLQSIQAGNAEDKKRLAGILQAMADEANDEIWREFRESFPGPSYRQGDPSRRSGHMENFLASGPIVRVVGNELVADYSQVNAQSHDVPHFYRLNYGTESLAGPPKAGAIPPQITFRIDSSRGGPLMTRIFQTDSARRPGFAFPGRAGNSFPFYFVNGQLYGRGPAGSAEPVPSSGIAPTYFVEQGLSTMARHLRPLMQEHLRIVRRRISRPR